MKSSRKTGLIGLIAHSEKRGARRVVEKTIAELTKRGIPYAMEAQTAALVGARSELDEAALAERSEILVVMGGDGTILRVAHKLGARLRPIFGINIGSLGFLTCAGPAEIAGAVDSIARKTYFLSPRNLLAVTLTSPHRAPLRFYGLNEVVISRGERSQLVKIDVRVDGTELTHYNADGLIVATPTGSTAYSLAAGGPVLTPDCGAFVITPICPHVLTNRSTVVSDRSVVEAQLRVPNQQVFLAVDGRSSHPMERGDILRISKSRRVLPLAMLPDRLFPAVLRHKLKWRGSNV